MKNWQKIAEAWGVNIPAADLERRAPALDATVGVRVGGAAVDDGAIILDIEKCHLSAKCLKLCVSSQRIESNYES